MPGGSVPVTPGDLDALVRVAKEVLAADPEVAAAYLYGSVVRGTVTPLSDVDIAVLPESTVSEADRGALVRRLITRFERLHLGVRFEVRCLDELPIAVRGRVLHEGVRIANRNPALRVEAEVRGRMEYHDFLPFERRFVREGLDGLRRKLGRG